MVAPTVALTAAPFRPTKSSGSAAGSRTSKKVRAGPAAGDREAGGSDRQRRLSSTLSDVKASTPLSRMGKKQTRNTMAIFGYMLKPNAVTMVGASAIFGTISRVTASG